MASSDESSCGAIVLPDLKRESAGILAPSSMLRIGGYGVGKGTLQNTRNFCLEVSFGLAVMEW